jgi:hypothetical protein
LKRKEDRRSPGKARSSPGRSTSSWRSSATERRAAFPALRRFERY